MSFTADGLIQTGGPERRKQEETTLLEGTIEEGLRMLGEESTGVLLVGDAAAVAVMVVVESKVSWKMSPVQVALALLMD